MVRAMSGSSALTRPAVQLAALTALALAVRLYHLGGLPLWLDETFTVRHATVGVGQLWREGFNHPPLYFWLHQIVLPWAPSPAVMRAPSLVFGTLAIPAMYALAREFVAHRTALIAAALLALSSIHVEYSQEARPYALFYLVTLIVLWASARYARLCADVTRSQTPFWQSANGALALYALAATLLLYTHNMSVFVLAALGLVMLFWTFADWPRSRQMFVRWIAATAVCFIAAGPWLIQLARMSVYGTPQFDWLEHAAWTNALDKALSVQGLHHVNRFQPWINAALFVLACLGAVRAANPRRFLPFFVIFAVVMPLFVWLVGFYQPIFMTRTIIWSAIPVYIAWAVFATGLESLIMRAVAVVGFVFVSTASVVNYYFYPQVDNWPAAAETVMEQRAEDDLLVLCPAHVSTPLRVYSPPAIVSRPFQTLSGDTMISRAWDWRDRRVAELKADNALDRASRVVFVEANCDPQQVHDTVSLLASRGWAETFDWRPREFATTRIRVFVPSTSSESTAVP